MTLGEFKTEIDKLNAEVREKYSDFENEIFPIFDGALDPDAYFHNKSHKILWLMKEAYDDDGGGDWSLPKLYTEDYNRFFSEIINGDSGRTWQPAVYTSYGILNDFSLWDDISFIAKDPSIVKILSKVAWVNIQKLPSATGNRTIVENIHDAFRRHKEIINKQIELLDPDIIICGNTYSVVREEYGNPPENKHDMVEYFSIGRRLVINAYHPSQFSISRERYVNNIVECTEMWMKLKENPQLQEAL